MATLNASQIAALVREHWDVDEKTLPVVVAIALAESNGRTDAINTANRNGSRDWGLFQVNDVNWKNETASQRLDPVTNTRKAYEVYKRQGLKAWVTFNVGAHEKFMNDALVGVSGSKGTSGAGGSGKVGDTDKPINPIGDKGVIGGFTNPFDALSSGLSDFQGTFMKILNSALLWIIAALFLILGIVLVMRRQVGAAASLAGPGKITKVAGVASNVAKVAKA